MCRPLGFLVRVLLCAFVVVQALHAEEPVSYSVNSYDFEFVGRTTPDGDRRILSYPNTVFKMAYNGTKVEMIVGELNPEENKEPTLFDVVVDGEFYKTMTVKDRKKHIVFRSKHPGLHQVEVHKRTDASFGEAVLEEVLIYGGDKAELQVSKPTTSDSDVSVSYGEFTNLIKAFKAGVEPETRQIMVVGDSVAVGLGNLGRYGRAESNAVPVNPRNTNAYYSFGSVLSRLMEAEYMCVCHSGAAIFQSGKTDKPILFKDLIELDRPNDPNSWTDYSAISPELIVLAVGHEDFLMKATKSPKADPFKENINALIDTLISNYPEAYIVLVNSPVLPDKNVSKKWPLKKYMHIYLNKTAKRYQKEHSFKVSKLKYDENKPQAFGEREHPTAQSHEELARKILAHYEKMKTLYDKKNKGAAAAKSSLEVTKLTIKDQYELITEYQEYEEAYEIDEEEEVLPQIDRRGQKSRGQRGGGQSKLVRIKHREARTAPAEIVEEVADTGEPAEPAPRIWFPSP